MLHSVNPQITGLAVRMCLGDGGKTSGACSQTLIEPVNSRFKVLNIKQWRGIERAKVDLWPLYVHKDMHIHINMYTDMNLYTDTSMHIKLSI